MSISPTPRPKIAGRPMPVTGTSGGSVGVGVLCAI